MYRLLLLSTITLFCFCLDNRLAGTSDDTLTGVQAKVYFADKKPAADATVQLFAANDTSPEASQQTATDQNGFFRMEGIRPGRYNIISEKDSFIAFIDSIQLNVDEKQLDDIILKPHSTLGGFVAVEPNHSPSIVTVHALGTYFFSNVENDGHFALFGLAEGAYTLCFRATDREYSPLYKYIEIGAGKTMLLSDTIRMIYNGIPVMHVPRIEYDTNAGVVRLQWSPTAYHNLNDYLVYRKNAAEQSWPLLYIANTIDTLYFDTIDFSDCDRYIATDEKCSKSLQYRIVVRSMADEIGEPYGAATITAVSPSILIPTAIAGNDTVVPGGDTIFLAGSRSFSLPGMIAEFSWDIGNKGHFVFSSTGDTSIAALSGYDDTLMCILRVIGKKNTVSYDTVLIISGSFQLAIANAQFSARSSMSSIVFHDTLWLIGGESGSSATVNNEIWFSTDGISWKMVPDGQWFSARSDHTSLLYHDTVWVIGGISQNTRLNDVWYSTDMRKWVQATAKAAFSDRVGHASVVFADKMWVIGGWHTDFDGVDKFTHVHLNDVWYSQNGVDWMLATEHAAFTGRWAHTAAVFDNKMWVIGGQEVASMYAKNDVWYSTDGINWTNAGSVGNHGWLHSKVTVFKNQLWLTGFSINDGIQANDVFASSDGLQWNMVIGNAPFKRRGYHEQIMYNGKLWVLGGRENSDMNDVWYLE